MPAAAAPANAANASKTKRVCDWLVRDKLLKAEQVENVLAHMQRTGERVEEALLGLGSTLGTWAALFVLNAQQLPR